MRTIKKRWNARTPKFWKNVQKIGIAAGAVGAAIIAAPIALPAAIVTTAGYLVAVGGITAALSQLTVENKKDIAD